MAKNKEPKHLGYWARKIFHILCNISFAIICLLIPDEYFLLCAIFAFIMVFVNEYIRLKTFAKKYYDDTVGLIYKSQEKEYFSSFFWGALGALFVAAFSSKEVLAFSFFVLAIADPLANILGKHISSPRIFRNKTLLGICTVFVSTALILYCSNNYLFGLDIHFMWFFFLPFVVTIMEMFSYPFDDNFTILASSGLIMHLIILNIF